MKRIDLTGKRFGALVAQRPVPSSETNDHRPGWLVLCDCGKSKVVNASHLRRGLITSCGCGCERGKRRSAAGNPNLIIDYTGQKLYELTALERVRGGEWRFRCSCGNEIVARFANVKAGKIQSCGHILQSVAHKKVEEDNVFEHYDGTLVIKLRHIMSSPTVHGIREIHMNNGQTVYKVRLVLRKKEIYIGTYTTRTEAEKARRDAEEKYYLPIIEQFDNK